MSSRQEKRFGELRAILQQPASEETWDQLATHLNGWKVDDYFEEVVAPYVLEYLAKWPEDVIRAAPAAWGKLLTKKKPSPLLRFANGLNMRKSKCGPKTLEKLLAADELESLIWLDLSENGLKNDGGVMIGKAPRVKNLKTLILQGCKIGNRGAVALASNRHLANLTSLDLSNNDMIDEGCSAIENSEFLHENIRKKAWDWYSYEREEREYYYNSWE